MVKAAFSPLPYAIGRYVVSVNGPVDPGRGSVGRSTARAASKAQSGGSKGSCPILHIFYTLHTSRLVQSDPRWILLTFHDWMLRHACHEKMRSIVQHVKRQNCHGAWQCLLHPAAFDPSCSEPARNAMAESLAWRIKVYLQWTGMAAATQPKMWGMLATAKDSVDFMSLVMIHVGVHCFLFSIDVSCVGFLGCCAAECNCDLVVIYVLGVQLLSRCVLEGLGVHNSY